MAQPGLAIASGDQVQLVTLFAILIVVAFWSWSAASARARNEGISSTEFASRCPTGYRKSTITARCVRNGFRFPSFSWN